MDSVETRLARIETKLETLIDQQSELFKLARAADQELNLLKGQQIGAKWVGNLFAGAVGALAALVVMWGRLSGKHP